MTDWPNHAAPLREWRNALAGERMHHAWLLAGKHGLGKRDFALQAARELVIGQGGAYHGRDHPDIIVLTHEPKDEKAERARADGKPFELARSIRIKQIRAMQRRLTTRPTLGDRRAIIIDPADDMEKAAANALLKSLEEPPQGTFFLLVAHRPARLLPTIRSRCRILRFPQLSQIELESMLGARGIAFSQSAIDAAEGSYGAALRFATQDLVPVAEMIETLLDKGDPDFVLRGDLARKIGPRADRDRLEAVLELAQALVVRRARSTGSKAQATRLIDAHSALVSLAAQAPSFNFDTGLLALEIGTLLVAAAPASEQAYG